MAAATTAIVGAYKASPGPFMDLSAAAESIPSGALVMVNAAGFIANGTDTSGCFVAGVATESVDNSAGSAGDKTINVDIGGAIVKVTHEAGSMAQANVGDAVMVQLNNEVSDAATSTNDIAAGVVLSIVSATVVWVKLRPLGVAS